MYRKKANEDPAFLKSESKQQVDHDFYTEEEYYWVCVHIIIFRVLGVLGFGFHGLV